MGRTIAYPQFVNVNSIKSITKGNYRYLLKIPFINRLNSKTLCVILKNPSVANIANCDNTVSKVCNVAYHNGYSDVIILNLFPYRSTQAKKVLDFYNMPNFANIMGRNLFIVKKISHKKDVVFAWGTDTISSTKQYKIIYDNAIKDVVSVITSNTYYVISCSCANRYKCI